MRALSHSRSRHLIPVSALHLQIAPCLWIIFHWDIRCLDLYFDIFLYPFNTCLLSQRISVIESTSTQFDDSSGLVQLCLCVWQMFFMSHLAFSRPGTNYFEILTILALIRIHWSSETKQTQPWRRQVTPRRLYTEGLDWCSSV